MTAVTPGREVLKAREANMRDLASDLEVAREAYLTAMEAQNPDVMAARREVLERMLWDDKGLIIDALRLAAKPADEGWQDISTAPRDGTRVLATGGGLGNEIEIVNYNERVGCWDAQNDTLDDRDDEPQGYNRPTLWQPLPAPSSTTVAPKLDPPDNSLTDPSTMGEVE